MATVATQGFCDPFRKIKKLFLGKKSIRTEAKFNKLRFECECVFIESHLGMLFFRKLRPCRQIFDFFA